MIKFTEATYNGRTDIFAYENPEILETEIERYYQEKDSEKIKLKRINRSDLRISKRFQNEDYVLWMNSSRTSAFRITT